MSKFVKLLTIFSLIIFFIASPVFATNTTDTAISTTDTPEEDITKLISSNTINDDLFVNNTDSYTLDNILYGNAFISTDNLTITSRNKGGVIFGDLFASTVNTTIQSDLVYSNSKDKIGNYLIDTVKSSSVINGNVYIVATDTFTLEAKNEIRGDLYVFAKNVNIEAGSVITGNVFVFANSTLNLHGKISGSVYATASQCNMDYTGYVAKDLLLSVTSFANISGKVDRTTKLSSDTGKIVTTSDFITGKNLIVESNDFQFAGEVHGDAKLSSRALSFNNEKTCIIRGNLDYATKSELTVPDEIVVGETSSAEYIDRNAFSYKLLNVAVRFISLLLYVFVVSLVFKYITPDFIEKLSNITTTKIFVGLGVGFGLMLIALPLVLLLIITKFTISLAFVLLLSILFIAAIAVPLFILSIANAWKSEKLNLYLKMLIITTIIFIVNLIHTLGTTLILLFTIVAIGRLLATLFYKKN